MSIETIRMALGRLQDDPDDEAAWDELAEAVTSPSGLSQDEVERLLGLARARHEQRREWGPVARLLELEIALSQGSPVEVPMQAELARIYHEELVDVERGRATYQRLLQLRPGDPTATEAIEADEEKAARWREIVSRYVAEAESAGEDTFKSALYTSAADIAFRYGRTDAPGILETVAQQLDQALRLDKRNRRAAALAELVYAATKDAAASARIQEHVLAEAASKDDRLAAGLRLGRTASKKLGDPERAVRAYQAVLDLAPGQQDALAYLAEAYSSTGEWDHLVALYEDQLRGGGVRPAEEVGVLVQIAMVHWRMRGKPQEAEAYFERVRRADPAHAGMLAFFRELCTAKGDKNRLATILTDAQRAMKDGEDKRALATEIARLAESQENAQKAIEQYKTILRTDPENADARDALKRLYVQTSGHNALVELYRQDLERTPPDRHRRAPRSCARSRRSTASGPRTRAPSSPCCRRSWQLDDKDVDAVRELATIYEALGRWRDLLTTQQRLAELSADPAEKANLYRSAARRWLEQFSNVQNAVAAYEGLLEVQGDDAEAIEKLRELYQKRRAWPQLYTLYERQLAGTEGKARIEVLSEMAKLAAERLDRGADAISLQKQILEIDPHAPGVFDALEKQAEREKDFATLAEVLEQRVTAASDDAMRLNVLQKLGTVYSERLKDNAATKRTWLRVLEASPGHAKALRVLRDAYVAESDWDGLEGLYASQNDWEGLVEFLTSTADRASSPEDKVAISFRAARIYEEKLDAGERAARSYERVLTVHPKDERAARALVPIYEKEEKWARLPALYEILLGATEDETATVELLKKLAATTGGPLADKSRGRGVRAPCVRHRVRCRDARPARVVGPRRESVGGLRHRRARPAQEEEGPHQPAETFAAAQARRGVRPRARQARRGGGVVSRSGRVRSDRHGHHPDARSNPALHGAKRRSALALPAARRSGRRDRARRDLRGVGDARGGGLRRREGRLRAAPKSNRDHADAGRGAAFAVALADPGGRFRRRRRGRRASPRRVRGRRAGAPRGRARGPVPRSPRPPRGGVRRGGAGPRARRPRQRGHRDPRAPRGAAGDARVRRRGARHRIRALGDARREVAAPSRGARGREERPKAPRAAPRARQRPREEAVGARHRVRRGAEAP
jgi:tetratricopeptide (TPR) repeat protein